MGRMHAEKVPFWFTSQSRKTDRLLTCQVSKEAQLAELHRRAAEISILKFGRPISLEVQLLSL